MTTHVGDENSSTISITFPARRPKRLARRLRESQGKVRERAWLGEECQREGFVLEAIPGERSVELVIWLGDPVPPPPRPARPARPQYERHGL